MIKSLITACLILSACPAYAQMGAFGQTTEDMQQQQRMYQQEQEIQRQNAQIEQQQRDMENQRVQQEIQQQQIQAQAPGGGLYR
jgi:hypothetical protein